MKKIISLLHESQIMGKMIHTLDYCLQKELKDCESVLDLGCGSSSPLKKCNNIKYSIGVDIYSPYIQSSRLKKIHNKYIKKNITSARFKPRSFDAVLLIEVLEHLSCRDGLNILKKAELWARKKIIISTPNGFFLQNIHKDGNPWQKHMSGWSIHKLEEIGFVCKGLAGLKYLRAESDKSNKNYDLTSTIRFKPKLLWFVISTISQIITYYYPSLAFELFCVKKINGKI